MITGHQIAREPASKRQVEALCPALTTHPEREGALSEDAMLAMLRQPDLPPESVDQLSKNPAAVRSRKVRLAILEHPRTPRHVSIPLISGLFTFDLMQLALIPRAPADVKKLAERSLVRRLPKISAGERLSLARRASREVAGALLLDSEKRTVAAALNNPRMTEASVIQAVNAPAASPELIALVCRHAVWPLRREVRIALLRCQHRSQL